VAGEGGDSTPKDGFLMEAAARERIMVRKSLESIIADSESGPHLRRSLGPLQLTALGVGAIVGTGIFVLIGPATGLWAGPAIVVSMLIAAATCALVALCYAEFASMIPVAGSAYTYSYATLGEFYAWVIGWDLILEYAVGATAVAIGWSGYFYSITRQFGMPFEWTHPPESGGIVNIPAIAIVITLTLLLGRGAKEAVNFNTVIVGIKLSALTIFIIVGALSFNGANFTNFTPYGWGGAFTGAAIIFFAFIGFDAVSTAAEEAKNPAKDMKIAIIGSLGAASVIYVLVAIVAVGLLTPTFGLQQLGHSSSALADLLFEHGQAVTSAIIAAGALAAITSVLLVSLYAQPRLFFALARDGLLGERFAKIDPKSGVPKNTIYTTGFIVAFFAGFVGIGEAAELTNIGTLFAFVLVGWGVLKLRRERPDWPRPFKAPFFPIVPLASIGMSLVLMFSLPFVTWMRFLIWLGVGLFIYTYYGIIHSKAGEKAFGPIVAEPPVE
jgi:APA family basic amino acid/polyamine antiporter